MLTMEIVHFQYLGYFCLVDMIMILMIVGMLIFIIFMQFIMISLIIFLIIFPLIWLSSSLSSLLSLPLLSLLLSSSSTQWQLQRRHQNPQRMKILLVYILEPNSRQRLNKAHKANNASSGWNDCLMMWLHEISTSFNYLLENDDFSLFYYKSVTNQPTNGWTNLVIEMRGHV